MKKITIKEWKSLVSKNCEDSYSIAVCSAILILWEAQVKDKENAHKVLVAARLIRLSGAQAEMAIGFALSHKLDKKILDIRKTVRIKKFYIILISMVGVVLGFLFRSLLGRG